MSTLYIRKQLNITVKKVEYERNGKKMSFNKIETVLHGKRYTLKMPLDTAETYGLNGLEPGKSYTLINAVYNYDKTNAYPTAWLKKIDSFKEFNFDDVVPESDEE